MCGYLATLETIFARDMKYRDIWSKKAAASDSTDWISANVSSCIDTPKLLPSSILGIIKEIHIFSYNKKKHEKHYFSLRHISQETREYTLRPVVYGCINTENVNHLHQSSYIHCHVILEGLFIFMCHYYISYLYTHKTKLKEANLKPSLFSFRQVLIERIVCG